MRARFVKGWVACAGLFTCTAWAAENRVSAADWPRLRAHIDGAVSTLMHQHHTVGGVVAVEQAGEIMMLQGYGWQDLASGKRVDAGATLFRQASISKLLTWVAVMQLEEQGALALDEDVNRYLREVRIPDTYPGRPVTLRHCMTHTAGFEEGFFGFLHPVTLEGAPEPAEALRRYQPRRISAPGESPAYSNYCAALAGLIVADVSGVAFADYVHSRIIAPLGMNSATFHQPAPEHLQDNVAVAYSWAGGLHRARSDYTTPGYLPTGGLLASAPDMLRFGRALLNEGVLGGTRVLSAESVRELLHQQFTLDERLRGIGLGFLQFPRGNLTVVGHNGNSTNFSTHFGMLRERDLVIYVAFGGPGYREVQSAVTRELYRELLPEELKQAATSGPVFAQSLRQFAGVYASRRNNSSTLEKVLRLRSQVKVAALDDGALMIGSKRYRSIGPQLFRGEEDDDLVAFQADAAGRVSGYAYDGVPYLSLYRVPWYETAAFNRWLLQVCVLVFVGVILRTLYQRQRQRNTPVADRTARRAAFIASVAMLWTLAFGAYALAVAVQSLFSAVPVILKGALIFPLVCTVAAINLWFRVAEVWRRGLLESAWERLRYSAVGVAAAAMVWFFSFWNMLGFRYA